MYLPSLLSLLSSLGRTPPPINPNPFLTPDPPTPTPDGAAFRLKKYSFSVQVESYLGCDQKSKYSLEWRNHRLGQLWTETWSPQVDIGETKIWLSFEGVGKRGECSNSWLRIEAETLIKSNAIDRWCSFHNVFFAKNAPVLWLKKGSKMLIWRWTHFQSLTHSQNKGAGGGMQENGSEEDADQVWPQVLQHHRVQRSWSKFKPDVLHFCLFTKYNFQGALGWKPGVGRGGLAKSCVCYSPHLPPPAHTAPLETPAPCSAMTYDHDWQTWWVTWRSLWLSVLVGCGQSQESCLFQASIKLILIQDRETALEDALAVVKAHSFPHLDVTSVYLHRAVFLVENNKVKNVGSSDPDNLDKSSWPETILFC